MDKFFGRTGYSFIEFWTIGHICFWIWAGTITAGLRFNRLWTMVICLCLAYLFEVFEYFGEKLWPQIATHPESWWNRWLSDPLMCVLGLLFAWYGFDHWRSSMEAL